MHRYRDGLEEEVRVLADPHPRVLLQHSSYS